MFVFIFFCLQKHFQRAHSAICDVKQREDKAFSDECERVTVSCMNWARVRKWKRKYRPSWTEQSGVLWLAYGCANIMV